MQKATYTHIHAEAKAIQCHACTCTRRPHEYDYPHPLAPLSLSPTYASWEGGWTGICDYRDNTIKRDRYNLICRWVGGRARKHAYAKTKIGDLIKCAIRAILTQDPQFGLALNFALSPYFRVHLRWALFDCLSSAHRFTSVLCSSWLCCLR